MAVTTVSGCAHGSFYNSPFFLQSVSIGGVTPEPDSFLQVPQNESSCVKQPLFWSLNWRASYKAELSLPKEPELRTSCSVVRTSEGLPLGQQAALRLPCLGARWPRAPGSSLRLVGWVSQEDLGHSPVSPELSCSPEGARGWGHFS